MKLMRSVLASVRADYEFRLKARAPLTLIELRATYSGLFYRNQDWFAGEAFMRVLPNERIPRSPDDVQSRGRIPRSSKGLPLAVDLANAYVNDPLNKVWDRWLWCRDTDRFGRRVFVAGLTFGHGFQIHRHIDVNGDFGVPTWR